MWVIYLVGKMRLSQVLPVIISMISLLTEQAKSVEIGRILG